METKSRYEVIAELEQRKRDLIDERDSLSRQLQQKRKEVVLITRKRDDYLLFVGREIEDKENEISEFEKSMDERKDTIKELIQSVDDSLERFTKLQKEKS